MTSNNLLDIIRENKTALVVSWIGIILVPFIFVLGAFLFTKHMGINISKALIIINIMVFGLYLIINKARLLHKYLVDIEPVILKDIQTWLSEMNMSSSSLKRGGKYDIYIASLPVVAFFLLYFISFQLPITFLREFFVFSIICQIFLVSTFKFISFKNYLNELIQIYVSLVRSSGKEVDEPEILKYDIKKTFYFALILGIIYFLISYFILSDAKIIHLLLFSFAFCVLFLMGKGLSDAYKGFYKSLSQIDKLRNMLNISA